MIMHSDQYSTRDITWFKFRNEYNNH